MTIRVFTRNSVGIPTLTTATIPQNDALPAFSQVDGSPLYCVTLSGKAMCIGCANHGRQMGCTQDDDNPDWFLIALRPHLGGETCHQCRRKIHTTSKRDAMPLVMRDELVANGYIAVLDYDDPAEVLLRRDDGGIDVFAIRDSFAGWCLDTSDGRVLEFCCSIPDEPH